MVRGRAAAVGRGAPMRRRTVRYGRRTWPTSSPRRSSRGRSTSSCTWWARHEVDILDIPLAPVVDAFVAHLTEHRHDLAMDVLSEFLLMAAILVELKSQRLLPGPDDVDDDEELVGWEERDLLLARLLECRGLRRRGRRLRRPGRAGGPLGPPRGRPRRRLRGPRPGPPGRGHPRPAGPGLPAGHRRTAGPAGRPLPRDGRRRHGVRDRGRRWPGSCPGRGRTTFRQLTGRPQHPHGGDRPLPGPPRAVQAGQGRPRPGEHLRGPGGGVDRRGPRPLAGVGWLGVDEYDG